MNLKTAKEILESMKRHKMRVPQEKVVISIPDAKTVLKNALKFFIEMEGKQALWLPEYNQVAEWLSNNEGRGLFLYGNCGRGKTVLAQYVIPAILLKYYRKVVTCYDAQEMNKKIDDVLQRKIISLDDIGTEDVLFSYGNKRLAFLEVIDAAEKQRKLVIVTSNLNHEQLIEKYGDRAMDRIIATTRRVLFAGKSLRS